MIALALTSMGNGVNQTLQSELKNEALFVFFCHSVVRNPRLSDERK